MNSELFQRLAAEFSQIRAQGEKLTETLTEDQWVWRPAPYKWSVADCISHLNLTNQRYLERLDRATAKLAPEGEATRSSQTIVGRVFVWLMEPPARLRLPAPRPFLPPPQFDIAELRRKFDESHDTLASRSRDALRMDYSSIRLHSPGSAKIQFNLADMLAILAAHDRRHLWQARRVLARDDFPA